MKRIGHLFLNICLLCIFNAQAQVNTDSLRTVWNNVDLQAEERLSALQALIAKVYMRSNPDSCLHYAQLYEKTALQTDSKEHIANSYHLQGVAYYFKNDAKNSLLALKKSLDSRGDQGDASARASTRNVMGAVYMQQGNHAQAMINYMACLKLSEELGDSRGISGASHNIGRIYSHKKEFEKALLSFQKSLEHKKDDRGIADELDVIGTCYADLDQTLSALEHFDRALQIRVKIKDSIGIGMSFGNIGEFYLAENQLDSARKYVLNSLKTFESINDARGVATANLNLSRIYQLENDYVKAVEYGSIALKMAQGLAVARLIRESANSLFLSHKQLKHSEEALAMYELYITMRDSINSEENQREIINQEYKYTYEKEALTDSLNFAKKEAVLQEQTEKQQIGLLATGGGLLLLLLLAFAIYSGKKKSDELLLNILPEETAKELKAKGEADAKLIDEVTVLFTDFKGFTAMSEQLSPKDLVRDIHECFSEFDRICEKHNIEKIKTIGDAYMAAGGLPTPNTTHAADVVKAALEMRDFVEAGKNLKISKGLPFFEIRIGVHTGPVVAGIVGIKKFQYDIWGDTVNTASRMESSGEVGKVNISQSTYELLKQESQFSFEPRGKVAAKGKGEIEMYFVKRFT